MKSGHPVDLRVDALSRRRFLGGAVAGGLALLSQVRYTIGDESLPPPKFLLEWGQHGKGEGEFDACVGIAIGRNEEVYTAEFRNQRVQRFTSEGMFLSTFPVQPHAGGLAVDAEGNVYVAHWNSNKVAAYSPTGELLREWAFGSVDRGKHRENAGFVGLVAPMVAIDSAENGCKPLTTVAETDPELARVVAAWPTLSAVVKRMILATLDGE